MFQIVPLVKLVLLERFLLKVVFQVTLVLLVVMVNIGVELSVKAVLLVNIKHYLLQLVRLVHFVQQVHGHLQALLHVVCVLQEPILLHQVHHLV